MRLANIDSSVHADAKPKNNNPNTEITKHPIEYVCYSMFIINIEKV